MKKLRRHILPGSKVLDVGGADVNGSYRVHFTDCTYTTLDFDPKADIVVEGYEWQVESESFDAVVCGQMFEHDRFFWLTMENIARVLRPGGHAILVVPSTGPVHRYPVDCYRFYPDSMQALADWARLELVEQGQNRVEPWHDVAAVFRKPEE